MIIGFIKFKFNFLSNELIIVCPDNVNKEIKIKQ